MNQTEQILQALREMLDALTPEEKNQVEDLIVNNPEVNFLHHLIS